MSLISVHGNTHGEHSDTVRILLKYVNPFCVRTVIFLTRLSMERERIGIGEVKKKNSVALVRERTIPTERPPPVGEVSANFCG